MDNSFKKIMDAYDKSIIKEASYVLPNMTFTEEDLKQLNELGFKVDNDNHTATLSFPGSTLKFTCAGVESVFVKLLMNEDNSDLYTNALNDAVNNIFMHHEFKDPKAAFDFYLDQLKAMSNSVDRIQNQLKAMSDEVA